MKWTISILSFFLMTTQTINPTITLSETINTTIEVSSMDEETAYALMAERWLLKLVGDQTAGLQDSQVLAYQDKMREEGERLYERMDKTSDRERLWPEKEPTTSADMTATFLNIKKMTFAYVLEGGTLTHDEQFYHEIISAIDFAIQLYNYTGTTYSGNWWDWQIGTTHEFISILFLLNKTMEGSKLDGYLSILSTYAYDPNVQLPNVKATGANLTDIGIAVLGIGILKQDSAMITKVQQSVPSVFKIVTSGDGLYRDGSMIQHNYYAYAGSYGNELLKGVGHCLYILDQTPWQFAQADLDNVFTYIEKGMLRIVFQGQLMASMQGRSISRAPGTNKYSTAFMGGSEVSANLLVVAQAAPSELKQKIYNAVYQWTQKSEDYYDFIENARDFQHLVGLKEAAIYANEDPLYQGLHVFGSMDRAVYHGASYTASLSMYSSRIYNFEYLNNENKKGWHTGDGMLYIYSDDQEQFGDKYWATVDSYRLPGTTVDTRSLANGAGSASRSSEKNVGGVTDGQNGSAVFVLNKNGNQGKDLKAQKSYFFLDDQIIMLGAGISGTTTATIETIIDQRMIHEGDAVYINGVVLESGSLETTLEKNDWIYIDTGNPETSIGYIMMETTLVHSEIASRSGNYQEINDLFITDTVYEADYVTFSIMHSTQGEQDTYAYRIVPKSTLTSLQENALSTSVQVLENSTTAQVIYDYTNQKLIGNTYASLSLEVPSITDTYENLEVNQAMSFILEETNDELKVWLSNPSQNNLSLILKIDGTMQKVINQDSTIRVNDLSTLEIVFDSLSQAGTTSHVNLLKIADFSLLNQKIQAVESLTESDYTPLSYQRLKEALDASYTYLQQTEHLNSEIQTFVEIIDDALLKLDRRANLSVIQESIMKGQEYLTQAITPYWSEQLRTMIEEAQVIVNDLNSTQSVVDSLEEKLSNLLDQLEFQIDFTIVNQILNNHQALDKELYTVTSWELVSLKAEVLMEDVSAYDPYQFLGYTQVDINLHVRDYQSAFAALVRVEPTEVLPETGVSQATLVYQSIGLCVLGIFILGFSHKRREK